MPIAFTFYLSLCSWQNILIYTHLTFFDWLCNFVSWVIEFVMHWWLDLHVIWSIHLAYWLYEKALVLWFKPLVWIVSYNTWYWFRFVCLVLKLWHNFWLHEWFIHLPKVSIDWLKWHSCNTYVCVLNSWKRRRLYHSNDYSAWTENSSTTFAWCH